MSTPHHFDQSDNPTRVERKALCLDVQALVVGVGPADSGPEHQVVLVYTDEGLTLRLRARRKLLTDFAEACLPKAGAGRPRREAQA